MRRYALLLALTLAPVLPAQEKISQVRQDLLDPIVEASGECLALAKAIPEDKYKWRPMEGVRSFGEVFAHMAGSTLLFCSYAGVKPPAGAAHDLAVIYMKRGFEMSEIFAAERAMQTKAQTIEAMDQAFHVASDMIRKIPDGDLEKRIHFFGTPMTMRGLLIHLDEHLGEHLGQAIAYARVNHIVPPWSQQK